MGLCPLSSQFARGASRDEFTDQTVKSTYRLGPRRDQLMTTVRQQLQRHVLVVRTHHPQVGAVERSPRDRHRIGLIGLAAMTRRVDPNPGGQLARNINHQLTGRHQPLSDTASDPVRTLHRPHPINELRRRPQHGDQPVATVIKPSPHTHRLIPAQHRHRVGSLVWIETDHHPGHSRLLLVASHMLKGTGSASSSRANLSSATPHPRPRPRAIREPQPEPGLGSRFTSEPSRTSTQRLT